MTEQMTASSRAAAEPRRAALLLYPVWLIENNEHPINGGAGTAWLDQIFRYCMMDQLSLPVVLEAFRA